MIGRLAKLRAQLQDMKIWISHNLNLLPEFESPTSQKSAVCYQPRWVSETDMVNNTK